MLIVESNTLVDQLSHASNSKRWPADDWSDAGV